MRLAISSFLFLLPPPHHALLIPSCSQAGVFFLSIHPLLFFIKAHRCSSQPASLRAGVVSARFASTTAKSQSLKERVAELIPSQIEKASILISLVFWHVC